MEWLNWIEINKWKLLIGSLLLCFAIFFTEAIFDALYNHAISNWLFKFLLDRVYRP